MNRVIVFIIKIMIFVLKKLGKGTAFPGNLAIKMNKDILSYFEMPKTTIFVTGTTGKTSVSRTLYELYKNAGYKTVSNVKGSNLIGGVTTAIIEASKISGKTKVDALIIECDERYVKKVFKYITPKYFVINNLSRDQLARNGHFGIVFDDINNSINSKTHLILNADDPLVVKFSLNKKNKITYYGVKENKYSTKTNKINTLDLGYCPICHKKLEYDYFNYGNLGSYKCPKGDFVRPICKYEAELMKNNQFKVEDNIITMNSDAIYNVYNFMACYTVCKVDKMDNDVLVDGINHLSKQAKRLTEFEMNGVKGTILLSKNETPLSYNQSLEYVKTKREKKTVAVGFTRVSGRYDLKDLSWLYDINFELLNDKSIERIILIGPFAYDLAVRLKTAGVDTKKFVYCVDYNNSLDFAVSHAKGNLYFVVYFDLDYMYLDQLKKKGVNL